MRRNIVFIILSLFCLIGMSACDANQLVSEPAEVLDASIVSEPAIGIYSIESIEFEYPPEWTYTENPTEDVFFVNFSDGAIVAPSILQFEQGFEWLTDFKVTKDDYYFYLSDTYADMNIIDLSNTTIEGNKAIKLIYTYTLEGKQYTASHYETVKGVRAFHFTFRSLTEELDKNQSIFDAVIDSVHLSD